MVYVRDLDIYHYHAGPFDPENWSVPLRYVGWLEYPHRFSLASAPPELVSKLVAMVKQSRRAYPGFCFRGMENCSICIAHRNPSPGPIWSQENIFVPSLDVVYVAPGGIPHYVESHSYLPPSEFIDAVLRCPDCDTAEYRDALCTAKNGINPPFVYRESYNRR